MCLQRKLEAHAGCVNTASFDTEGGDVLISGSDDQQILLWDWERGECCSYTAIQHQQQQQHSTIMRSSGSCKSVGISQKFHVWLAPWHSVAVPVAISSAAAVPLVTSSS
jgi:WD40 repeat protein